MYTQPTLQPTKIVVAMTDPPIARFIALALQLDGYDPQALTDGDEVLASALTESVAAVVLERGLAKRDGVDVCARLRAASSLPIVLVLQREEAYLQPRAKERGATACLRAAVRRGGVARLRSGAASPGSAVPCLMTELPPGGAWLAVSTPPHSYVGT